MALLKKTAILAALSPLAALAEGASYTSPPGMSEALNTAKATAEGMAGEVVPAAVVILFAFAGLVGVYLIWRIFRRGAGGR